MRDIARQKQDVWVCKASTVEVEAYDELTGEMLPCGEKADVYNKPVCYRMCVNPSVGWAKYSAYGLTQDTKREITTVDQSLDIDIGDCLFVDVTPTLDTEGMLAQDAFGNYITLPDYYVAYIYKSERGNQTRIGITIRGEGQ